MEWRPVLGFEGIYEVSEYGDVRRVVASGAWPAGRPLKPIVNNDGKNYRYFRLQHEGRQEKRKAHRLVLEAFVGPGDGLFGLHADDDKSNNHVSNLRWGTRLDNAADYRRNQGVWVGWRARLTHCQNGHEFTPENTYREPSGKRRRCRECRRNRGSN